MTWHICNKKLYDQPKYLPSSKSTTTLVNIIQIILSTYDLIDCLLERATFALAICVKSWRICVGHNLSKNFMAWMSSWRGRLILHMYGSSHLLWHGPMDFQLTLCLAQWPTNVQLWTASLCLLVNPHIRCFYLHIRCLCLHIGFICLHRCLSFHNLLYLGQGFTLRCGFLMGVLKFNTSWQ